MRSRRKIVFAVGLISVTAIGCAGNGTQSDPGPVSDSNPVETQVVKASQASTVAMLAGPSVDAATGAGSLWILTRSTQGRRGRLVRVDLDPGRLVFSTAIAGPQAVTFGSGSVWVAQGEADRVIRLDPRSGQVLATIRLSLPRPVSDTPDGSDFRPFDIAAGGGAIWVSTARGSVARIEPNTNRITEQISIPFESSADLAVGRGAIWLAGDLDGVRRIGIDDGSQTAIPIESPDRSRLSVTSLTPAGGSVYVTGTWAAVSEAEGYVGTDEAALVELSASRGRATHTLPLPEAMVVRPGSENSVWLSPWISRSIFSVGSDAPKIGLAARLPEPGHLLATVDDEFWVERSNRTVARYPVEVPR